MPRTAVPLPSRPIPTPGHELPVDRGSPRSTVSSSPPKFAPLPAGSARRATVRADVVQHCAATDLPVPATLAEPFDLRFLRDVDAPVGEDEEIEISSDDLDLLPLEGDRIDLGEAAVQTLSLALDPFPRHPDANRILAEKGVLSEEAAGPFRGAREAARKARRLAAFVGRGFRFFGDQVGNRGIEPRLVLGVLLAGAASASGFFLGRRLRRCFSSRVGGNAPPSALASPSNCSPITLSTAGAISPTLKRI